MSLPFGSDETTKLELFNSCGFLYCSCTDFGSISHLGTLFHSPLFHQLRIQPSLANLRHKSYQGVNVVVLCFSVVRPHTFHSIRTTWLPELRDAGLLPPPPSQRQSGSSWQQQRGSWKGKRTPTPSTSPQPTTATSPRLLLVGCACDLRDDIGQILRLSQQGQQSPVDQASAERLANELSAFAYVECSSLTEKNLKTLFDLVIWCGLKTISHQHQSPAPVVNNNGSLLHQPSSSLPSTVSTIPRHDRKFPIIEDRKRISLPPKPPRRRRGCCSCCFSGGAER